MRSSCHPVSARPRAGRRLIAVTALAVATALVGAGGPARAAQIGAPPKAVVAAQAVPVEGKAATAHTVTWDGYSFLIDGKRTYLWSGEFHYFRLPSPDLWRDVLTKMKAAGFNATSIYFDWAYHSPKRGVYDFTGVRDVDKLLDIADEVGIYVIARPGPYINAEVDSGGFPGWLTTQAGQARTTAPDYLAASDEWLTRIDAILARHQLTNGTGTVITYQVENEFYSPSTDGRAYMAHLEAKARADGITVPLVGNHNNNFNTGAGALDVDMVDSYPQGFNCSTPTVWNGVGSLTWGQSPGKPLSTAEFQGGAFDPWGGPGYENCRKLTGPDFEKVFYKENIAEGLTEQNFYMLYGGTSWGWQPDPNQVYTSYDYGAAITEPRQLTTKYDEDKRIGYFTQSVAPLTKTDPLTTSAPTSTAIQDTGRINPDDHTQFHVLRHVDSTSSATDSTHIAIDLEAGSAPPVSFTYDDVDQALQYTGTWTHAGAEQSWTAGDYAHTESFSSTAGDSVTVPFTGSSVRWVSGRDGNHGIAEVYLDDKLVKTVDTYGSTKTTKQVFYEADDLPAGEHTLTIKATGTKNAASSGTFVVIDAIDLKPTPAPTSATYPSVPQQAGTAITLAGRDSKIIVANYALGAQQLRYSTSEIMTHTRIGDRDVALLYGRDGEDGETVLHYAAQPKVTVLSGDVQSTWDADRGDLRLNYVHHGLARVLVSGGPRPLLLLLGTDETAATFWRQQTPAGPVLVRGPDLVRTASGTGATLRLTGDTSSDRDIEVFSGATGITWNGKQVATTLTPSGSRLGALTGPRPVTLPTLTGWRHAAESPEAATAFDDSRWRVADKLTSNSSTQVGNMTPVLYADDYGFHYGDVWYRGRFRAGATGAPTGVNLSAITGRAGIYSAWLNGVFLGSSTDPAHSFVFPAGSLKTGTGDARADNVLSVLVENMGHNEDYNHNDTHKEARGLIGAMLVGTPQGAITWRLQGARGGEDLADPVRGPMNNGGLYGERSGWHLPGFRDSSWAAVSLPASEPTPGVSWYRTTVRLDLPKTQDTSVGLRIDDAATRHYRAEIFVNGWLLGRYINDVGPQHSFPIPTGILKPNGENTIAIAGWNADGSTGGLGRVSLESYGTHVSPLSVAPVDSPRYHAGDYPASTAPGVNVSLTAPDTIKGGQTVEVSAVVTVPSSAPAATGVSTDLVLPDGWTSTPGTPAPGVTVAPGTSQTLTWQVKAAAEVKPGGSVIRVVTGYQQGAAAATASDTRVLRTLPPPPTADSAVSAVPFQFATNGWGPVERDTSNGEAAAGDGKPITIGSTVYSHGLGVNAPSDISFWLDRHCTRLTATVGVDAEVGTQGSVTFSVVADGKPVFTSPVLTGSSAALPIDVDLTGVSTLELVTGDGGNGNGSDHADWADAQLKCS